MEDNKTYLDRQSVRYLINNGYTPSCNVNITFYELVVLLEEWAEITKNDKLYSGQQ